MVPILAQAPPPPPPGPGAASAFTNIFWLSIGFIFLSAIIGAILARRRKDRVLKLIHDFHVTLTLTSGSSSWGDLWVFPQGMEVRYDAAYSTQTGAIKSSYMLYDNEVAQLLALCRWDGDQSPREREDRVAQVRKRACPGPVRRLQRWVSNWFNTIRDAFSQAFSAFLGQVGRARPGSVIQTQQGQVEKIGQTFLQGPGYSYEPMLEKHIGLPVVLEVAIPNDPHKRLFDLAGYLAEYSKDYIAIFNIDHRPGGTLEIAAGENVEREGVKIDVHPQQLIVTNTEPVPLVIESMVSDSCEPRRMGVALLQGAVARLPKLPGNLVLKLLRVERLDVVCTRAQARVRHGALDTLPAEPALNLPPTHRDRRVRFPWRRRPRRVAAELHQSQG